VNRCAFPHGCVSRLVFAEFAESTTIKAGLEKTSHAFRTGLQMPCWIKSRKLRGRIVEYLASGLVVVYLAGIGQVTVPRSDIEIGEHAPEENRNPVNPCVGRYVQVAAITSTTPAPDRIVFYGGNGSETFEFH
jgi:hypothetical protein